MSYLTELAMAIKAEVPLSVLPNEDTGQLFLVYAVLLLSKGELVTGADVHNAWVAWMEARGEHHPSMRPFEELPTATRQEDSPFTDAIRRVARRLAGS